MKKSMILFLFLKLLIITIEISDIDIIFKGKCEDKKAKTDACLYKLNNYDSQKHVKYAIFDKCGKNEHCDFNYNSAGICIDNDLYETRKIGKSCNYDQDCETGSCASNKCTAAKEGDKCSDISCESGLHCPHEFSIEPKCTKLAKENEKPDKTKCIGGLGLDKDGKCAKYGTVEDGNELGDGDELICKSGLSHGTATLTTICDSIEIEPECNENGLKTQGKWKDGTPILFGCSKEEDYSGNKIYYNTEYSKLRSKFYAEFLEDYNDLDLNKINSNEKYSSWEDGMKSKTKEKLTLYYYATHLKAAGIIDSDGKVIKDKKCEYEFMMKNNLHSNYIKLNTIILALIVLLF